MKVSLGAGALWARLAATIGSNRCWSLLIQTRLLRRGVRWTPRLQRPGGIAGIGAA
jgi:hypothetical protein